jgi:hypothetical protein
MAGGSAREGVCIAAGVTVVGGACEWRKENSDNLNTTQTPEYTKDKYNAKIMK